MGAAVPPDSVATGSITVVAGSKTDTGTIRTLTRGLDQTDEEIDFSTEHRAVIYSRAYANEIQGTSTKSLPLELVVTSQSANSPLHLIAGALNNPDLAAQYIGLENLDGASVHHIRIWNTFSSQPDLRSLAEFTAQDIWVDGTTYLPRKLSYERRAGSGAVPHIRMEVYYSNYQNVSGVLYPFLVQKSLNGTPWATIAIQNVALNTGLSDSDFPVTQGAK